MRATWKVPKGGTTGLSMSVEVFSPALENRREEGRALSMTVQLWNGIAKLNRQREEEPVLNMTVGVSEEGGSGETVTNGTKNKTIT